MPSLDALATAEPGVAGRARLRRWTFWGAAYATSVLVAGTNLPTPLYRGYQARFGFSPLVTTMIFAVYAGVLIPTLLVAGPLSDSVDRRRVLLPAVGVAALGSLTFALATGTAWLFAARILQGVAIGAALSALTAALSDLEPNGDRRRAALVTTVAAAGGLGAGPVLAGALAQYAPAPRVLPFVVEIALLAPAALAVSVRSDVRAATRWRPRRPGIPREMRTIFATSGSANFLASAVLGLFLCLVPAYVALLSGSANLLLGGASAALMLGCSGVAQVAAYGRRAVEPVGLPLLALGLGLLAVAGGIGSLALLLTATVIAGVGHGLVFLGSLTAVNQAAPADRHAEVLSTYYVILYLGIGVPVVGVGVLATATGLLAAVQWFAGAVAVLCLVLLPATRRAASGG